MSMYDIINWMRATTEFRAKAEFAQAVCRCMKIAKDTDRWNHYQRDVLMREALDSLRGMRIMYNAMSDNKFSINDYNKITRLIWKAFYYYDSKAE